MRTASCEPLTALLLQLLGQSSALVVQRPILKMLDGDFSAALLLSQIVYWTQRTDDKDGWFWKTCDQWEDEICLSRCQIDRAVKVLASFGVERETRRRNNSPVAFYRVRHDVLIKRVKEYVAANVAACVPARTTCRFSTGASVENLQVVPVENPQVYITKTTKAKITAAAEAPEPLPIVLAEASTLAAADKQNSQAEEAQTSSETVAVPLPVMPAESPRSEPLQAAHSHATTEAGQRVTPAPDASTSAMVAPSAPTAAPVSASPVLSLLDLPDEAAAALSPEEIIPRFRALNPAKRYLDKLSEIQNRPGMRAYRVVQKKEILAVLPELREERDRQQARSNKPQSPPVVSEFESKLAKQHADASSAGEERNKAAFRAFQMARRGKQAPQNITGGMAA